MDTKHRELSMFFWGLISLIDQGFSESIEDTKAHIERRDVVQWLVSKYGEPHFKGTDHEDLNDRIHDFVADSSAHPYDVSNNGLLFLIHISAALEP